MIEIPQHYTPRGIESDYAGDLGEEMVKNKIKKEGYRCKHSYECGTACYGCDLRSRGKNIEVKACFSPRTLRNGKKTWTFYSADYQQNYYDIMAVCLNNKEGGAFVFGEILFYPKNYIKAFRTDSGFSITEDSLRYKIGFKTFKNCLKDMKKPRKERKFNIKPFSTVDELAGYLGLTRQAVYARLSNGWRIDEATSKKKMANQWVEYAKTKGKQGVVDNCS